jgi:two-component system, LytTR family, sensor kinase
MPDSSIMKKIRLTSVMTHLAVWMLSIILLTVLIVFTRNFSLSALNLKFAVNILLTVLFLAVSVYINFFWLIPAFFNRRRYFLFALLEVLNIGLFIFLNYFESAIVEGKFPESSMTEITAEFFLVLVFLIISTLIKFTRDSVSLRKAEIRIKEVQRQNMESELSALKNQINPHFFFNTLNSLYSLSLDKSEKVPDLILRLSGLMRFLLYETTDDLVPMSKQLEFLRNYFFLEKLRLDDDTRIGLNIRGDHLETEISPLIFLPLIENAFKHGAKEKASHPYIRADISLENPGEVDMVIENNTDPPAEKEARKSEGIGLINVRKRLELLYPGRHTMEIFNDGRVFRVRLTVREI